MVDADFELHAFEAYEQQIHTRIFGGERGSVWLDDQDFREQLTPEQQKALWKSGTVGSEAVSLTTALELIRTTGFVDGRRAVREDVQEYVDAIENNQKTLAQIRARITELREQGA